MTEIGSVKRVAVQVFDEDDALANATAVTLTIALPDGTSVGPFTPDNPSTGVYQYDHAVTQAGRHLCHWLATGTNAGSSTTSFEANDPAREPLIQPEDLRNALRDTAITEDHAEAAVLLASGLVRGYCRQEITRATWTHRLPLDYGPTGWFVTLPQRPLVSVSAVTVNDVEVTPIVVDLLRNRVALPNGFTYAADGVDDQAVVTYVAGASTVPGDVRSVALAVAMRLYDNPTGLRSETIDDYTLTRGGSDDDIAGVTLTASEKLTLGAYRPRASTVRPS